MGIAMVGMTRGMRPAVLKLGPEHYFAFRKNAKAEADELERWQYFRSATTPLPDAHGRKWCLNAQVWLRDRFIFKLVPMVNPDGVINGNYRCDDPPTRHCWGVEAVLMLCCGSPGHRSLVTISCTGSNRWHRCIGSKAPSPSSSFLRRRRAALRDHRV